MNGEWKRLGLTDTGKLLAMFFAATEYEEELKIDRAIEKHKLDTYVYLLSQRNIVPFKYRFYHNPKPVSAELEEDVWDMVDLGYLDMHSPFTLSNQGIVWAQGKFSEQDAVQLLKPIAQQLAEFQEKDDLELSRFVYVNLTSSPV